MLTNDSKPLVAISDSRDIFILPEMLNRHGLIAGATGTGKTVSLQTLAETFSSLGVSVFMADVKGDLGGISEKGDEASKAYKRVKELKLDARGFEPRNFPVSFWDCYGEKGHPLRATISDVGPMLLSRLLGLNDVQSGVLDMVFKIADDNGLLLLDLKDLRSMVQYVSDEREQFRASYGLVSPASAGAILRGLLKLEQAGGDIFFGEPALDIMDLLKSRGGKGVINILDATRLVNSPELYSCVLLWLLSELYERLPERGDQPKPRLVFFLDEAHLLFKDLNHELSSKIEQVVRLIRSRGVGVFFVSQNPSDIPDAILGQLGNRIQHALRAFTPKDQKAVRAAAQAFRPNPAFSTAEAISNLGVGEALVSFLDANGAPQIVQRALITPPEGKIGPIEASARKRLIVQDEIGSKYDESLDRESAYELLSERAQKLQADKDAQEWAKAREKALKELEKQTRREEQEKKREEKRLAAEARQNDPLGALLGSVVRQTTRNVGISVARQIGKATIGGTVGGQIGASIMRGLLGGILGGKK